MRMSASSTCWCLLFVLVATTPAFPQTVSDQLIVRFAPGTLQPPPRRTGGAIEEFSFSRLEVYNGLVSAGVEHLTRVFPWFKSEDCDSKNLIGEPVLLEDLSAFYNVSLRLGTSGDADTRVRSIPGVINAEWPRLGRPLSADTYFDKQWGLHNTGGSICSPYNGPPPVADSDSTPTDINAPEAWLIEKGLNATVRVGIIDSGIRASHEDFGGTGGGRVTGGVTFAPVQPQPLCPGGGLQCDVEPASCTFGPLFAQDDDLSHGTAVAGIVAATGDNMMGVAGVAWGITLVPIKILDCNQEVVSCNSARAIDWARTESIPILNMSYDTSQQTAAERAAVRNAFYSGQLLVAAAGNDSGRTVVPPANYAKTVCAVGAYFRNGRRWLQHLITGSPNARGSSYGPELDLAAPGGAMIASTHWGHRCADNSYNALATCSDGFSGTSSAAPVVAGVEALLLSKYPSLLGEDLYRAMIITARHPDVDSLGVEKAFDDSAGFGHVRADTALKFFASPKVITHRRETGLSVVSIDTSQRYLANLPGITTGTYTVYRYLMRKSITFNPSFDSTPVAWVRSSGSFGVKDTAHYDYDEEVWSGRVVSISPTGCTIESNVYEIPSAPLLYRWFPIVPSPHVAVALTIVGVPAGGQGASLEDPVLVNPTPTEAALLPGAFALGQNEPNPFSTSTTIRFTLPAGTTVSLEVFDAAGRLVRTLANGQFPAGVHDVDWDHRDEGGHPLRAGVYLYRIRAGTFGDQKKMVLLGR